MASPSLSSSPSLGTCLMPGAGAAPVPPVDPCWGWDRPGLPGPACPPSHFWGGTPKIVAPGPRQLPAWLHHGTWTCVLFLHYGSVCSGVTCLHSLIASTNGLHLVGFTFSDQSYFEWNLTDKTFNFLLISSRLMSDCLCWIKNLGC